MKLSLTRLSTRGQVVIPESIRLELKLRVGQVFLVETGRDRDSGKPIIIFTPIELAELKGKKK